MTLIVIYSIFPLSCIITGLAASSQSHKLLSESSYNHSINLKIVCLNDWSCLLSLIGSKQAFKSFTERGVIKLDCHIYSSVSLAAIDDQSFCIYLCANESGT